MSYGSAIKHASEQAWESGSAVGYVYYRWDENLARLERAYLTRTGAPAFLNWAASNYACHLRLPFEPSPPLYITKWRNDLLPCKMSLLELMSRLQPADDAVGSTLTEKTP